MNIVLWVLQVLLAVAMFLHGYVYVVWPDSLVERVRQRRPDRARPELNPNFRRFIGLAECAAALGLILPGLTGILPWLTVFFWNAKPMWTEARSEDNGFNWQRFALVWAAVIFVFFSVSGSKLPSYILPIFPALALAIGSQLTTLPAATLARLTLPLVVAAGVATLTVLFAYAPIAAHFAGTREPLGSGPGELRTWKIRGEKRGAR